MDWLKLNVYGRVLQWGGCILRLFIRFRCEDLVETAFYIDSDHLLQWYVLTLRMTCDKFKILQT